jgi:hypothetical protein
LRPRPKPANQKQITLDAWLNERLGDKLKRASIAAATSHKPFILYRIPMEDINDATQEEIAILNGDYIVVQLYTYGGFLPSSFQELHVFSLYEFQTWLKERSHELLLLCISNLDKES